MAATTWGLGDYPLMAERLMPAARAVVELAGVGAGERVLDVACGTGNAALLAADLGADATGVDLEPALLEIARARGGEARFVEGDVAALPFEDARFDATLSVFGVMYAPDHERAARELTRVTKPGGHIALAAWTRGSFMPRMGAALAPYLPPPPPGSGPPSRWGDPAELETLLGLQLDAAETRRLTIEADVDFLIATAGHVLAERESSRRRTAGRRSARTSRSWPASAARSSSSTSSPSPGARPPAAAGPPRSKCRAG